MYTLSIILIYIKLRTVQTWNINQNVFLIKNRSYSFQICILSKIDHFDIEKWCVTFPVEQSTFPSAVCLMDHRIRSFWHVLFCILFFSYYYTFRTMKIRNIMIIYAQCEIVPNRYTLKCQLRNNTICRVSNDTRKCPIVLYSCHE